MGVFHKDACKDLPYENRAFLPPTCIFPWADATVMCLEMNLVGVNLCF